MHVNNGQAGLLIESVAVSVHHQGHWFGLPKGSHQCTQLSAFSVTHACMQMCNRQFCLQQDLKRVCTRTASGYWLLSSVDNMQVRSLEQYTTL